MLTAIQYWERYKDTVAEHMVFDTISSRRRFQRFHVQPVCKFVTTTASFYPNYPGDYVKVTLQPSSINNDYKFSVLVSGYDDTMLRFTTENPELACQKFIDVKDGVDYGILKELGFVHD